MPLSATACEYSKCVCLRNQPLETQRWILTGELGNRPEGLDRTFFPTESDCKPLLHRKQRDHGGRHQA